MKRNFLAYLCIMFSYLIIDVVYQITIGLKMMARIYQNAGISNIISAEPQYAATIPLFFLIIAYALWVLVVKSAIEQDSILQALGKGALLGIAAYGTLGLVFLWSIKGYPIAALFGVLFEGLLFPSVSSALTAWLFTRKAHRSNLK